MAGVQIDGVNNKIDFDDDLDTSISANTDDTLVIEAGGNTMATITATTFTINDGTTITTADNTDTLTLISTDADASIGPNLDFYRNSSSPADNDLIGLMSFRGRNDNSQDVDYAKILTQVADASDGTEDGILDIRTILAGTEVQRAVFSSTETVFNEESKDLDFRVESNDGTHALFVDAGNNVVIVGGIDGSGTTPVPTNTNGGTDPVFQLQGANNANQHTFHISAAIDAQNNPGSIVFSKSRDNTLNGNTILENGDRIGEIIFCAADGTDRNSEAAKICSDVDGTPGSNDMPGRLEFHTTADGANTSTERMRILSTGNICVGQTDDQGGTRFLVAYDVANDSAGGFRCTNASFVNIVLKASANKSGNNNFELFRCASNNENDPEFLVKGDGTVFADGAYDGSGADYAEYFEWKDGNSSNEDRRGYSVVLDGNKIVKATDSDDASKIIGVISGNPAVVGDSAWNKWNQKHLKDDFGTYIWEDYTVTEWTETVEDGDEIQHVQHSYPTDEIPDGVTAPSDATVLTTEKDKYGNDVNIKRRKINPDWNKDTVYISREDRKEWDTVGLTGKLRLKKGQPTGTNWIKMRDISDSVEEWLVR
jgi:hypothetical protein